MKKICEECGVPWTVRYRTLAESYLCIACYDNYFKEEKVYEVKE